MEKISINLKEIFRASVYIGSLFWGLIGGTACDPQMELSGDVEDFTVTLLTPKIKAGEQAVFEFTGDPDIISVFTGEVYSEYSCREHRILESGDYNLSFSTATKYGVQENHFSILISSDFNGNYSDISHVKAATWTDITDRFTIATGNTNGTYVNSGTLKMNEFMEESKPVYIGLRYVNQATAIAGACRTWYVRDFQLSTETNLFGEQVIADMSSAGFSLVDAGIGGACRSTILSVITLLGPAGTSSQEASENWMITKPLVRQSQIDLGPDRPTPLKGMTEQRLSEYKYIYKEPGKYRVTFVATNANADRSQTVVREVEIEVEP